MKALPSCIALAENRNEQHTGRFCQCRPCQCFQVGLAASQVDHWHEVDAEDAIADSDLASYLRACQWLASEESSLNRCASSSTWKLRPSRSLDAVYALLAKISRSFKLREFPRTSSSNLNNLHADSEHSPVLPTGTLTVLSASVCQCLPCPHAAIAPGPSALQAAAGAASTSRGATSTHSPWSSRACGSHIYGERLQCLCQCADHIYSICYLFCFLPLLAQPASVRQSVSWAQST